MLRGGILDNRHPTLWETYEFIFQALEAGRATVKEAREFHRLMLLGPSHGRMRRFTQLRKKLGVEMVLDGQITPESLLAYARQHEGDRKYDTRVISRKVTREGDKTHFEE